MLFILALAKHCSDGIVAYIDDVAFRDVGDGGANVEESWHVGV